MSDTCEECGSGGEIHVRGMSGGVALCTACAAAAVDSVDDETLNEAIQNLFDKHKAAGTVVALVAALLDVQAVVIATVEHDGGAAVEYALDKNATSATVAAVLDLVATAAASLGARSGT